jgi:hypothetical protein
VFGLTPSKYQSGEINRTGAISKCGDEMMRVMLYEAAQIMLVRTAKWSWLKAWAMKIAMHRGMKKAIVALARRLAVIMHAQVKSKSMLLEEAIEARKTSFIASKFITRALRVAAPIDLRSRCPARTAPFCFGSPRSATTFLPSTRWAGTRDLV